MFLSGLHILMQCSFVSKMLTSKTGAIAVHRDLYQIKCCGYIGSDENMLAGIGTADRYDKLSMLTTMVRCDPCIHSCIKRICCDVIPSEVNIEENGKPLAPKFAQQIGGQWCSFLCSAVEMAYFCGFVVFTVKKQEGLKIPVILPLGSFVWSIEAVTKTSKKRSYEESLLYRYKVTCTHPDVIEDNLHIYPFMQPVVDFNSVLPSPLDHLCKLYVNIVQIERKMDDVMKWNATKHITTSERVEIPRDNTTDGISLLDDFRRYVVSGEHTGISRQFMTLNGKHQKHSNPNNANYMWITDQFGNESEMASSKVHVLPPNTDIVELANLDLKINSRELSDSYQEQVYMFFGMTMTDRVGNNAGSAQYASKSEIKNMFIMSKFCQRLSSFAYSVCYDVKMENIVVDLPIPSGMHIQSADDIKKLGESNILLPSDAMKLRKRMMSNI